MRSLLFLAGLFMLLLAHGQSAPPHLRYFGFSLVDMYWDDPHDLDATTNYIAEVDTFSNIAQLGVFSPTDNIVSRVQLMGVHCVKPLLSIQSIFYSEVDVDAPSGHRFSLVSDFTARWDNFKLINNSVLTPDQVGAFYVADEPVWNGITAEELDTICEIIKRDFPDIPLMFVEAYPVLNSLVIPEEVDWVGFDRYAIFDPTTSTVFQDDLATLKSLRSTSSQKLFLIIDDQWLPFYGDAGYTPDTIRFMVQHYYDLAASDEDIIGLIGYLWAGGLDDPAQLGVRDMPASVIDKNVEIGKRIKANYNPCVTTHTQEPITQASIQIFPNPASEYLQCNFLNSGINTNIEIYNAVGLLMFDQSISSESVVDLSRFPMGMYIIRFKHVPDYSQILIISH